MLQPCVPVNRILLRFRQRLTLLVFIHDRVAPEHGIGAMPGNPHCDGLRYASGNHVAGSRTAEIVEDLPPVPSGYSTFLTSASRTFTRAPLAYHLAQSRSHTGRSPGLPKITYGVAVIVKDKFRRSDMLSEQKQSTTRQPNAQETNPGITRKNWIRGVFI